MRSGIVLLALCGLCAVGIPAKPPAQPKLPPPVATAWFKELDKATPILYVQSPRDTATGQASGKHRHRVVLGVAQQDAKSFLTALTNNENIVEIRFSGKNGQTRRIPLKGAKITKLPNRSGLSYQEIEWTWISGITANDDWETPIAGRRKRGG